MSGPALLLFGIAATSSTATGSLLYAALTIAAAVGGPVFGVALDRAGHPGRLLAGALLSYGLGLGVVAGILGRAPVALAVGLAVLVGLLAPALAGGWTSQLAHVLPTDELARGHAMDAATYNIASLAGPTLAAVATSIWGSEWAVAGSIVFLLAATPLAWRLPAREPVRVIGRPLRGGLAVDLRAGSRALAEITGLRTITIASCIAYLGFGIFAVACPSLGQANLGGEGRGALLLSLVAATALMTTATMSRWPPRWSHETTFLAATSLAVVGLLLAASARNSAVLIAGVAVLGAGEGPQLAAIFALRQRDAPVHLRGQIFTTAASLKLTAGAVGAAMAGALLSHSTSAALAIAALMQGVALLYFRMTTQPRR